MDRPLVVLETCPDCGAHLVVRFSRKSKAHFIGCADWPDCTFSEAYDARVQRLADTIRSLSDRLAQQATTAMPAELVAREVRRLMAEFHPDRNPGGIDATRVCAELSNLRDRVK